MRKIMAEAPEKNFPLKSKDYELYEEVGEGVSATVYRALCVPRNEIVAIKVLDLEKCHNDLDGIRREVQTMILLDHPNVLQAHCSFSAGRHLWVVMPFMAGGSCLHIMKSAFPDGFEEPIIASLLFEVLKALTYLHNHSHIHRDVKAGNILIDHDGAVKLADFGVSASMLDTGDRKRVRNTFVGTPCWMAPEVMQQLHGYDFKADIWSFGITALELAHGHAPFSKYPPMKVLLMTLQNAPPGLDYERDKRFSKAFKEMVAACLVKDPKKRPSSEKLLKHPLFKNARSGDFLSRAILDGLPPLGERFRMLKAKESELLVQNKTLYENMDHLSQQEYIRGISMWNFNLEDMKNQAELIQDDPSIDSEDSSISRKHQDRRSDIGFPVERLHTNQGDYDTAACLMEDGNDNIDDLEDSLAAFPIKPLQALKGCFDVYEDDVVSPSSKDSAQSDSEQKRTNQSVKVSMDREPVIDACGDDAQSRSLHKKFPSSLLLQENSLASKKLTGYGDRDCLQLKLISERNYSGPLQHRLKKDISSPTFGGDTSESGGVKYRGRFKVTSADLTPKGLPVQCVSSGGPPRQMLPSLSAGTLLLSLKHLLQQNTSQREEIVKMIKLMEKSSGYSNELMQSGSNDISQVAATVRERDLQTHVIQMQESIGKLVEELQRLKTKNAQLERRINDYEVEDSSGGG